MENERTGELILLRGKINQIDAQLLPLFLSRMQVSAEVADYKRRAGIPVRDEAREEELLARIGAQAGDMDQYAQALYREILSLSRAYQEKLLGRDGEAQAK